MKTALPKEASRVIVVQDHLLQDQQEQSEQRTSPLGACFMLRSAAIVEKTGDVQNPPSLPTCMDRGVLGSTSRCTEML